MPLYLASSYLPENFDPSTVTEAMIRDIDVMNEQLVAAGARIFGAGLFPASSTKSLRAQPDGKVIVTDGPYLETKEVIGGFWVIEAPDLDRALALAAEGSKACGGKVEVRPFDGLA